MTAKRTAVGACALMLAMGMSGCALTVPPRSKVAEQTLRSGLATPVIAQDGVLTVGLDTEAAPLAMIDSAGKPDGYLVDVACALADRMGLGLVIMPNTSPDQVGVQGGPDIYLGADPDDSDKAVTVSSAILEDAPALFARAKGGSAPAAPSVDDLASATIAVQESSATQDLLNAADIKAEQKTYKNINECLEALEAGEVDYAACDAASGAYLSRLYDDVVYAGALDATESMGVAFKTKNVQLSDVLTSELDEISADGTLDALRTLWFGRAWPQTLEGTMVGGITTSEERERAEREEREDEQDGDTGQDSDVEDTGADDAADAIDTAEASAADGFDEADPASWEDDSF